MNYIYLSFSGVMAYIIVEIQLFISMQFEIQFLWKEDEVFNCGWDKKEIKIFLYLLSTNFKSVSQRSILNFD